VLQLYDWDCTAIIVALSFAQIVVIYRSILFIEWCKWLCLVTCNSGALYEWIKCCLIYLGKDGLIDRMWELLTFLPLALLYSHPLFFACTAASHQNPPHYCILHLKDFKHGWLQWILCQHVQLKLNCKFKSKKVLCEMQWCRRDTKGCVRGKECKQKWCEQDWAFYHERQILPRIFALHSVLQLNMFRMCLHCKHVLNV